MITNPICERFLKEFINIGIYYPSFYLNWYVRISKFNKCVFVRIWKSVETENGRQKNEKHILMIIKVQVFWEGHKSLTQSLLSNVKTLRTIGPNFCGLFRISELYDPINRKYSKLIFFFSANFSYWIFNLGNKTKPANKSEKQTKNLPINPCETNKQKSRNQ